MASLNVDTRDKENTAARDVGFLANKSSAARAGGLKGAFADKNAFAAKPKARSFGVRDLNTPRKALGDVKNTLQHNNTPGDDLKPKKTPLASRPQSTTGQDCVAAPKMPTMEEAEYEKVETCSYLNDNDAFACDAGDALGPWSERLFSQVPPSLFTQRLYEHTLGDWTEVDAQLDSLPSQERDKLDRQTVAEVAADMRAVLADLADWNPDEDSVDGEDD